MAEETIFNEATPVYDPFVQKRYWLIIVGLFCASTAYSLYSVIQETLGLHKLLLLTQQFNLILRLADTAFSTLSLILFLRKLRPGWIIAAGIIAFWTTLWIVMVVFFVNRGNYGLCLRPLILFAGYAVLLFLIQLPTIRAIYGVNKPLALRIMLFGSLAALAFFTIEMIEPYWRLRHTNHYSAIVSVFQCQQTQQARKAQ